MTTDTTGPIEWTDECGRRCSLPVSREILRSAGFVPLAELEASQRELAEKKEALQAREAELARVAEAWNTYSFGAADEDATDELHSAIAAVALAFKLRSAAMPSPATVQTSPIPAVQNWCANCGKTQTIPPMYCSTCYASLVVKPHQELAVRATPGCKWPW